jgi:hypothetical protein
MTNVLGTSCTENQNTHFMFNNFFPKIAPFIIPKNLVEAENPQMTSQYGAYALHAELSRLYARMRRHVPTRPLTHMHAGTQASK